MMIILSLCGHPCLRAWVGGLRSCLAMDNFRPNPNFIPPRTVHGGVERNSPAGKNFHKILIPICRFEMLPEWTKERMTESALLWSLGSKPNLRPQTIAKQRRKKVSDGVSFRCHLCSHVHFQMFAAETVMLFSGFCFVLGWFGLCYL